MSSVYTANALDLPVALLGQSMATTVPRDSLCSDPDGVLMFTSSSTGQRLGRMLVWETPAHLGVCTQGRIVSYSLQKPEVSRNGGGETLRMRRLYLDLPIAGWDRAV